MIKTFNNLRKVGNFFNPIKDIYEKPKANITHNDERLNAVPIRPGTNQTGRSILAFSIALKVLAKGCYARKRHKRQPNWKGRSKTISK